MTGQANLELLVLGVLVASVAIMVAVLGYYLPIKVSSSGLGEVARAQNGKVPGVCRELAEYWM
ncbi:MULTISPECIES: hypothetical protein [unclassified Methanopyrus]|uniref:hypothetical protein n=1 Tax=unclassified Methanopyrus TaxID=2684913 RepID=UPI000B4B00F8|nr:MULTISPECIES: hypothetical protein [unclassified Methanopyrus]